jgi:hypothetical protein
MTKTRASFYLKVCPHLYCFADCPAMVTDTHMPARVDTVTIREVVSRRHRLQVYHTTGVFSQSGNHTGMVYVHPSEPSAHLPRKSSVRLEFTIERQPMYPAVSTTVSCAHLPSSSAVLRRDSLTETMNKMACSTLMCIPVSASKMSRVCV